MRNESRGHFRTQIEEEFGAGAVGEFPDADAPHLEKRTLDIVKSLVESVRLLATQVDVLSAEIDQLKRN